MLGEQNNVVCLGLENLCAKTKSHMAHSKAYSLSMNPVHWYFRFSWNAEEQIKTAVLRSSSHWNWTKPVRLCKSVLNISLKCPFMVTALIMGDGKRGLASSLLMMSLLTLGGRGGHVDC